MSCYNSICVIILQMVTLSSPMEVIETLEFLNLKAVENLEIIVGFNENIPVGLPDLLHSWNSQFQSNFGVFHSNDSSKIPNTKSSKDLVIILNPDNESNINKSFENMEDLVLKMPVWKYGYSYIILAWPTTVNSEIQIPGILRSNKIVNFTDAFTFDTNVFVLFKLTNSSKFTLWEIYMIRTMTTFKELVKPDVMMSFKEIALRIPSSRRQNFHEDYAVAVAIYNDRYAADTKFSNSTVRWEFKSGLSVRLYRDLQYMLNFTEIAIPGGWMSAYENGTLSGASAYWLSHREIADISISQENMRKNLARLVTFLHPTNPLSVVAFVKRPEYSLSRDIFIEPFSDELWLCLMTVCVWIAICFEIVCRCKSWTNFKLSDQDELQGQGLIFATGWLCQQGWYVFPATGALKIIFLTSYFTGVIFYGAFTASLVSKLSVRVSQLNSLQDLLNNQYSLLISSQSVSMAEFAQGFGSHYNARVTSLPPSEILERLLNSKAALMFYWDSIDATFSYNRSKPTSPVLLCETITTFRIFKDKPSGMVVRKGSPFREVFNQKIIKIKESGLNFRYVKHYQLRTQPQCLPTSQIRHTSLSFVDIVSAFYLLVIGAGVSFLVVLIERCLLNTQHQYR